MSANSLRENEGATFCTISTKAGWFGAAFIHGRLARTYLPMRRSTLHAAILKDYPNAFEVEGPQAFQRAITSYFSGHPTAFDVDVDLTAQPEFYRRVLLACKRIPAGQTITYAELGVRAGRKNAARAVGSAMAGNPLPLIIPCHRVVRSDGSMGGFSSPGGIRQKIEMLRLEGVNVSDAGKTPPATPDIVESPIRRSRTVAMI